MVPGSRPVVLRPLEPDDRDHLARAIDRLSETTRYQRFHSAGFRPNHQKADYLNAVETWAVRVAAYPEPLSGPVANQA